MPPRLHVASVLGNVLVAGVALAVDAYDGSSYGPADAACRIKINDRRALNYLATAPSDLGLGRAYATGYLDIEGDVYQALLLASQEAASIGWADRLDALRRLGFDVLRPITKPPEEARPGIWWGLRHSRQRDSRAISHHYDVSNTFYEWLLGPTMSYTCAVYPRVGASLEEAQREKADLVCRKLDLQAGQRLLDVGCGWGTLLLHAAQHYGVSGVGVTLSRQQAEWGQRRIAEVGLSGIVEIRHDDYRNVAETGFDAVSSIGLTEHIGAKNLAAYVRFLASKLRRQGRFLNHCVTRPLSTAPARTGSFVNRYVFPDSELVSVGAVVSAIEDNGLEVRHEENFREHYALTCEAWSANLEAHWDEAVREVGEGTARVWRLWLAASRLGFVQRRLELHQVLAVRAEEGVSGIPLERLTFSR